MTGCIDGQGVFAQHKVLVWRYGSVLSIYHFDDSGPDRTSFVLKKYETVITETHTIHKN